MRFTLRSHVLAPVILMAAAFTAHSAMAETKLDVPFNFTVDGKPCPAGQYTVRVDERANAVHMTGAARGFTWLLVPDNSLSNNNRVILKFDEVGSQHILRSVQYHNQTTTRLDKRSKVTDSVPAQSITGF
ncbi:MAG TPA: hypothetical protein VHD85_04700 [Terracidiphilus sp.]|nr:hypothetical protein [Terracidiphilus sp.]